MGSRRLPHPDSSGALNSTSPRKWGEVKARADCSVPRSPAPSPAGGVLRVRWVRTMPSMMVMPGTTNAATTSRSVPPAGHHIRLSDIARDIVRTAWGDVRPELSEWQEGAPVKPARARERPRPAWSNGSRGRRAVAGALIAPPRDEMVEIVPSKRRAARAYLFRPATPTVRA